MRATYTARLSPLKVITRPMIGDIDIFINCNWVITRWQ